MNADLLSAILAINNHTLALNTSLEAGDEDAALEAIAELRLATSTLKQLLGAPQPA